MHKKIVGFSCQNGYIKEPTCKKLLFVYILLVVLSLFLISSVNAADYSGNLSYTAPVTIESYNTVAGFATSGYLRAFNIVDTPAHNNLKYLFLLSSNSSSYVTHDPPNSDSTNVNIYIGTYYIGSGIFGYIENPTTGTISVYLSLNDFDASGFTGAQNFNLTGDATFTANGLNKLTLKKRIGVNPPSSVGFLTPAAPPDNDYAWQNPGYYNVYSGYTFFNSWEMISSGYIATTINVFKGTSPSRVLIYTNDTNSISDEGSINLVDYTLTTAQKPLKIAIKDAGNLFHNTSYYYNGTPNIYSLNITPATINYGDSFSIKLESSNATYDNIQEVRYGYTKSTGEIDILQDNTNQNNWADYLKIGGTWFQFDTLTNAYTINKGASLPNPVTIYGDTRGNIEVGDYTIKGYIFKTDNSMQEVTASLSITQSNNQKLTIEVKDYLTGDLLSGSRINVLDISKNLWNNISTATGSYTFDYAYRMPLYIEVTKTEYVTEAKNWTVTSVPFYRLWMILNRGITPPAGNTILYISVYDDYNLAPITGALVTVARFNDLSNINVQYTLDSGMVTFNVSANDKFVISVSKNGYQNGGTTLNTTGYGGSSLSDVIRLIRTSSVTPIPTVIPATTIITPQPTIQPIGVNITPSACKITLPANATIVDSIKNQIACAGITTGTNQGYIFAIGIIFILAIAGGKYGKGLGVLVGVISGFLISVGMELIPFWVFIAVLVVCGMVLATKIWQSG